MPLELVPIRSAEPSPWPYCLVCNVPHQRILVGSTDSGAVVLMLPVCVAHGVAVMLDPIRWELVDVPNAAPVLRRKEPHAPQRP
jgi:hypothetical protein